MPNTAARIVKEIYRAWLAHDLDKFEELLPENFSHVLLIPTEIHPLGGVCTGKAAMDRIRAVAAEFDFVEFDASSLIAEVNRVAVEIPIHYRHRATGVPLQTTFVHFWTFENGRPVKLTEYSDVVSMQEFMSNVAAQAPASI
jgi:ketosteroid isomerase-like protein